MILYNALAQTQFGPATYRIRFKAFSDNSFNAINNVQVRAFDTWPMNYLTQYIYFGTAPVNSDYVSGADFTGIVPMGYPHLQIFVVHTFIPAGVSYIKNLRVDYVKKAEVQDSDIVGRRHYDGTKITSTGINVDSPDTIDGGPVITINTVGSDSPSSNPIGSSLGVVATMTQQQQTGEA